jgi:multidrug efflux system membrane fusion protein
MKTLKSIKITLLVSLTALLLVACGEQPAQQANTPAAPKVDVANVLYERITEWDQFTGRIWTPPRLQVFRLIVFGITAYVYSVSK